MDIIKYGRNWVNKSGTVSTGGIAQTISVANPDREGFWFQNVSSGDLWLSELGAAAANQPSIKVPAGAMYEFPVSVGTAISVYGTTTGQAFSAREW